MGSYNITDWTVNPGSNFISYPKKTFLDKFIGLFGFPKFTVNQLYSLLMDKFSTPGMMSFDEPINAHGIKGSSVLYPRYRLVNKWDIRKRDLKHLIKGPLVSEDGKKVLVRKRPFWNTISWIMTGIFTIASGIDALIFLKRISYR